MFRSPALIDGEKVLIGVEEAEAIKEEVVNRGLCFEPEDSDAFPWMENIVSFFRESTTEPGFDHEFWGAWTLMPPWAQRVVSMFNGGWLDYPRKPSDLTAESLGEKVGRFLTLAEMKLQSIAEDPELREALEAAEWKKAVRGLDPEEAAKTTVKFPGFEDLQQMVAESGDALVPLRAMAFSMAGTQGAETCGTFFKGFVSGWQRARKIDVVSELSDFNLRMDVVVQLYHHWAHVDTLEKRPEIADFLLRHLSESKRAYFEADEQRWESFQGGVLRDLFREIGLNPAGKGRPRKNGANSRK